MINFKAQTTNKSLDDSPSQAEIIWAIKRFLSPSPLLDNSHYEANFKYVVCVGVLTNMLYLLN